MSGDVVFKGQCKESKMKRSYKGPSVENKVLAKPSSAPSSCGRKLKANDLQRKRAKPVLQTPEMEKSMKKLTSKGISKTVTEIKGSSSTTTLTEDDRLVLNKSKVVNQGNSVLRFLQTIDNVDQILKIETRLEDLEQKFRMLSSVLQQERAIMGEVVVDSFDNEDENALKVTKLQTTNTSICGEKGSAMTIKSPPLATENIFISRAVSASQLAMQYWPHYETYISRDFSLRKPFCLLLSRTVN